MGGVYDTPEFGEGLQMISRRDFLTRSAAALGALPEVLAVPFAATTELRELAAAALDAARHAGATYADIRINRYRSQGTPGDRTSASRP